MNKLFYIFQSEVVTGEGEAHLDLVCEVRGRPSPKVFWLKNGITLPPTGRLRQVQRSHLHTLTIFDVTEDDFGSYVCSSENLLGRDSAVLLVTGNNKNNSYNSNLIIIKSSNKNTNNN